MAELVVTTALPGRKYPSRHEDDLVAASLMERGTPRLPSERRNSARPSAPKEHDAEGASDATSVARIDELEPLRSV